MCVCVSVCPAPRVLPLSVQPKVPTASAQSGKRLRYGVFSKNALFKSYGVKKPTSLVCAYRDIIWRRWSDISPENSKTGPSLVLSKSNGRFQVGIVRQRATSHSAVQLCRFVVFRILSVTCPSIDACAFSKPRARATAL